MRVLHKLDRKALAAWIEAHDTEGRREDFLEPLASLGLGEAWVWAPSWLLQVWLQQPESFQCRFACLFRKTGQFVHNGRVRQISPKVLRQIIQKVTTACPQGSGRQSAAIQAKALPYQGAERSDFCHTGLDSSIVHTGPPW
jgi:hypothetical protein